MPVLWDYHVLLLAQLGEEPPLVLDLDRRVQVAGRACGHAAVGCCTAAAGCPAAVWHRLSALPGVRMSVCIGSCACASAGKQLAAARPDYRLVCPSTAAPSLVPACSTLPFPCSLHEYRCAALLGDDSSLAPQYRR